MRIILTRFLTEKNAFSQQRTFFFLGWLDSVSTVLRTLQFLNPYP